MAGKPSGTVSFLFTDIEGSTRAWEQNAAAMRDALRLHDSALKAAIESREGFLFKKTGDGIYAAFPEASLAIGAALEAQAALAETPDLRVRMGIYTGPAAESEGDYIGPTLNRTARLLEAAHGGQILLSQATSDLALGALPADASVVDLGLHHLRDLERAERIFQLCHPRIPGTFPPLRSLSAYKHNLPIQLTSLIGREANVAAVKGLLETHHLVTLYGSGGCGKTRLALQVGAEVLDSFLDGVWFVELMNAADALQAEQALVSALGLREEAGRDTGQAIIDYLREKTTLLILDNCEHLVDAVAKQAFELLRVCPNLRLLATSREVLGVRGEITYRVPSLQLPDDSAKQVDAAALSRLDSVRLFAERAGDVDSEFAITDANADHVAKICSRLDGIPLAIELAAARVRTLTLEQIWERLSDHFHILVGPRTAPSRQTTLHATVDWSYRLLDDQERVLLSRLTAFAGGWTLEAAESVCPSGAEFGSDDVVGLLGRLEEKSLIGVDRQPEWTRYRMLQMVREYASEQLSESESAELAGRHVEYFLQMVEEGEANISGPQQADWLKRLDRDHDNMRAALETCKQNPDLIESGLRLAGSLARYWHIRGILTEGRRQLTTLMEKETQELNTLGSGKSQNGLGILAWAQGDYDIALNAFEAALAIWTSHGDKLRKAGALSNLGLVSIATGAYTASEEFLFESLSTRQAINDLEGMSTSLNNLGLLCRTMEEFARAREYYERSLALRVALGDIRGVAECRNNLGEVAFNSGDLKRASELFLAALKDFESLGQKAGCIASLYNMAVIQYKSKDYSSARNCLLRGLDLANEVGDRWFQAVLPTRLGDICVAEGQLEDAKRYYSFSLRLLDPRTQRAIRGECLLRLAHLALIRGNAVEAASLLGNASSHYENSYGAWLTECERRQIEESIKHSLPNDCYEKAFILGSQLCVSDVFDLASGESVP